MGKIDTASSINNNKCGLFDVGRHIVINKTDKIIIVNKKVNKIFRILIFRVF